MGEAFMIPQDHARNLVDPKAYADGRIHETHTWLRANNPIGVARVDGFDPFWVITSYKDVREIGRDNKRFPSGERASVLTDQASVAFMLSLTGKPLIARSIISMDPPEHMKYRLLTQAWFMPKNLKTLDEQIASIASETVDKFINCGGACEFVSDIALHYPLEVIMNIIGVPKTDLPFMLRMTQEIFAPADPDSVPEGVDVQDPAFMAQALKASIGNLGEYFKKITDDRRITPRNDVATIIANSKMDGEYLSDLDILGYYVILATAGHDTTSSSTARVMFALASDAALFNRVKADLSLIPALIEEATRWETPVKTFMRSVSEDTEYAGRQFKKDDWIMLCYASANRDETVFPSGGKFDIERPKMDHLAFGFGPHVCLGQHLARQEMRALFERLIPVLKSVELAGRPDLSQSFFVNGLKRLPIRFVLEDQIT